MKYRLRLLLLRILGALLSRMRPLPERVQRVLVIRPDHLGDVLLSRPAIDALARALPDAQITLAVGPWGRAALGPSSATELLMCPFPGFSRAHLHVLQRYLLLLRYAVILRKRNYTMAVIMRPDHWWGALLAALAGIPVRIGYETPETAPFLTEALPYLPDRHAAREALTLVQAAARYAGASIAAEPEHEPTLPSSATATDAQAVEDLLRTAGVQHVPLLVLHPGAGSPLKSWPLERFVALGAELAAKMHARIAVTGTAGERLLCAQLCACLPGDTLNLAGRLSWGELEALLRRAALVVGVDSGPLHLAVAAGTPSVALFGPADPAQFAPWGPPARHRIVAADLPCQPCRRLDSCHVEPGGTGPPPCMRAIEIAPVLAAAQAALLEGKHAPITTH